MRILRTRVGFQADHSSSSYLFYAADKPVNRKGQQIAHRFSSRAEVDEHTARYQKWGDSDLSSRAYKELLTEHYDVMVSESYDWWTLMIAVPKTPDLKAALAPFSDARGYEDMGVEVEDYGSRLVAVVYCMFEYDGPAFEYEEDSLETLADLLVTIRAEILQGNTSFLQAVASFYGADEVDEEDEAEEERLPGDAPSRLPDNLSKADLQRECTTRGIAFRKSWTKEQLRAALTAAGPGPVTSQPAKSPWPNKPPRLSKAAKRIVDSLSRP